MYYTIGNLLLFALSGIALFASVGIAGGQPVAGSEETALSAEAAVAQALEVTGFDAPEYGLVSKESLTARMVSMADSTTPFLSDSLDGRQAWLVELPNVRLTMAHLDSSEQSAILRDFEVYLDPATGIPLRVQSRLPEFDEQYWRKPSADSATVFLQRVSMAYTEVPDHAPRVSFVQAMKVTRRMIPKAEEITALYVMESKGPEDPRSVWAFYLYGLETLASVRNPEAPPYQTHKCRCSVDAETGEFRFCCSYP